MGGKTHMNNLKSYLFETDAFKVCTNDKPFWYTSGKIGPYFINTHFVYGNEADAVALLSFIDVAKEDKLTMPKAVFDKIKVQYDTNTIYHEIIEELMEYIKANINVEDIDYISGGERRDWFFSYIASYLLQKPQITIFKDLTAVVSTSDFNETKPITSISGKKVLHIADLITIASSYIRAWIPAIQGLGGELVWSVSLVDRIQGGSERLTDLGIKSFAMVRIDESLFEMALAKKLIDENQYTMLVKFYQDPDGSMKEFLTTHPNFIKDALQADSKTAGRAKLCADANLYGLTD